MPNDDTRILPPTPDRPDEHPIIGWQFWPAPTVASTVERLIQDCTELAPLAGRLIVPRFSAKNISVAGAEVWTKLKKVNGLDACNIGVHADWFLLVSFPLWKGMPGMRDPAIHEALCRMGHDGSVLPNDFAGMASNARRWPTWKAGWAKYRDAVSGQLALDDLIVGIDSMTITTEDSTTTVRRDN